VFNLLFKDAPPSTFVEFWQPSGGGRKFYSPTEFPPSSTSYDSTIDTYFGVALRKSAGSEKDNVFGTKALWVDIDLLDAPQATLPPSITVHSGGGWHYYWLLDKYCTSNETIEAANKLLQEDTDGDHCFNCNRLLRVPGTTNTKNGHTAELRRQNSGIVYKIDDIAVLRKLDRKVRHKIRTGDRRGYRSRSERDWAIVESLVQAGASDSLVELLFRFQPCGDKYRDVEEGGKHYLEHTLEKIRDKPIAMIIRKASFSEEPDGYFVETSKGRKQLSTFTLKPKLLLVGIEGEDTIEDTIVCDVVASNYTWGDVMFPRSAFNDRRSLDKLLLKTAWSWFGRDDDIRSLLPYLLEQLQEIGLPRTASTSVLGRHGKYFVTSDQCLDGKDIYDGTEAPLVYLKTRKEAPQVHYVSEVQPPDWRNIIYLNDPSVIWPIIGWFTACPYKPILEGLNIRYPILNLYGTKGSGKTATLRVFQRLMGYTNTRSYNCTTTPFVMLALLGGTNAIPISFSEYRHSVADRILRYILLAYDTGHDPRGRSDQTTIDYPLCAPFSVDGEDAVGDPAAKERIVGVRMSPETIAEGTPAYKAFKPFEAQSVEMFAQAYHQYTLTQDVRGMLEESARGVHNAFPEPLPDRVRNNITVVTLGIYSFCNYLHFEIPDLRSVLESALKSVWSESMGRGKVLADEFVETIVNEVARGRAQFFYHVENNVLWFQLATSHMWWMKIKRGSIQTLLDRDAIRDQLDERNIKKGDKGQYVVSPKAVQKTWCYGVDIGRAAEAGLDVPSELDSTFTLEL